MDALTEVELARVAVELADVGAERGSGAAREQRDHDRDGERESGEDAIQDKINLNRAKARVAADLSGEGITDIKREQAMEKVKAEDALKEFEVQMGLRTPETAQTPTATKELGPAPKEKVKQK